MVPQWAVIQLIASVWHIKVVAKGKGSIRGFGYLIVERLITSTSFRELSTVLKTDSHFLMIKRMAVLQFIRYQKF